jgi:glycosyltransferase involved in cell wall biosynthesis
VKIAVFLNAIGLGGSEKAACRWAQALCERGHSVKVLSLEDGPRRADLEASGIEVFLLSRDEAIVRASLQELRCDVIHAHVPGHSHVGDVLGDALEQLPKIPVVQTNIFGRLDNPKEDRWTDFRLFISWTSCVQAARRAFRPLNEKFFQRASVASYPLDPDDGPAQAEREKFRRDHGIAPDEILFGRLSRPEPNKWTDLPVEAFRIAARRHAKIKLLLREPPPAVRHALEMSADRDRFVILPATSNASELATTIASLDAVLHTSIIGESFGYGIAEPMNYGKPVIANSTPWQDQAQIELVRHGFCGFIASTRTTMADAILRLAYDHELRGELGHNARTHVRELADVDESTNRLEIVLRAALFGTDNPFAREDVDKAQAAASYLDEQQFGHTWKEQIALRPFHYRVRLHDFRKSITR